MTGRRLRDDDRGVSRMLSYMLTVGIAMILVTGLFVSGSMLVEDQHERTLRSQMEVVGQRVAGSLEVADRFVRSTESPPSELSLTRSLPESLVGSSYTIEVNTGSVVVRRDDLSVTVGMETKTSVGTTSVRGGRIVIEYNPSSNKLVVHNA